MKKKIICFGDSNTWGYNPENGMQYDENTRWTMRLQNMLGSDYKVIEEGQNGRTIACQDPWEWGTKCGMDYVLPMIETHNPFDVLIIMLGSNDLKSKFSLTAGDIAGSLQNMLMKIRSELKYYLNNTSAKIVVVSPVLLGENLKDSRFSEFFDAKNARAVSKELAYWYKMVANQFECEFVDASLITEPSDFDSLHLTAKGHELIANCLYEKIVEITK